MLWICLEEDVCLYHPNARWGEFEWLKTLQGPQLDNCRKRLSFGVRKPYKKIIKQHLHHHMLFGRVLRKKNQEKNMLSPKNNLQHIQLSDTTGTSNGTGFYGQMKLKNELFSSKHSRWVWKWKWKSESDVTYGQVWWPILGICALHLSHPKCTHTAVNTHTPWTHTRSSGQPFMLRRPGSSWGFGALLKGTSVVVLRVERALYIHSPPPTIPAGPRLELATFGLWVRLSNH